MSYDVTARFFRWMDANNITRQHASELLGLDERSLSTYRSRGLPKKKQTRAEEVMRGHANNSSSSYSNEESTRIPVIFSDDEYSLVELAACITKCTASEFIHKAATTKAKEEIQKDQATSPDLLLVAEDPTPYGTKRGNG